MATRAVVFDFYGTLTTSATRAARRAGAARVAAALGVPAESFREALAGTFTQRATGSCGGFEPTMLWLAAQCGHMPSAGQLAEACRIRRATEHDYVRALRDDAEPTLSALKAQGLRTGLLSDCTHELPEIWASLPIARYVDATVFSVEAGLRKPHPKMYVAISRVIGVRPEECLYVGDGGSSELTGATAAGMTAYRLLADDAADAVVYDAEPAWTGGTVRSLSEVPRLVVAAPADVTSTAR